MTAVTATSRHFTASMVVIDPQAAHVLLVWHHASGALLFPGGHVDPDEDAAQAALREVREETGIIPALFITEPTVKLPGMRQLYNPWLTYEIPAPPKPRKGEPAHSHLDMLFIGTASSEVTPHAADEGTANAGWYSIAELDIQPVRAEVPEVARRALAMVLDAFEWSQR